MLHNLTKWLEDLINKAELDTESVSYFRDTKDSPYCIVGAGVKVTQTSSQTSYTQVNQILIMLCVLRL